MGAGEIEFVLNCCTQKKIDKAGEGERDARSPANDLRSHVPEEVKLL